MSREHKFRAYDKNNRHGKMGTIVEINFSKQECIVGFGDPDAFSEEGWGGYASYGFLLSEVELMESVDITDKHDKQAFMGDIVWFGKYDPDTGKKIRYVLDYQSFCYGVVPLQTYIDLEYCGGAFEMLRYQFPVKMEIIGNIWENAELMEVPV